jgi:hypothetical protein|tara:strand:- start:150 stop:860 length:711 start_codon:yes stop_codon:yes gene_type:complete
MDNKNEKGFALILSLLLLLVMSLMGGALIVIASGDHQSNNSSDQYQQAFYVAETGLLQAEKRIINSFMGDVVEGPPLTRNKSTIKKPVNKSGVLKSDGEDCYKSFRNLNPSTLMVTDHEIKQNFGTLISSIFTKPSDVDNIDYGSTDEEDECSSPVCKEEAYLKRFEYEYFSVNIGEAPIMVSGSSINMGQSDSQTLGVSYRLYACGILYGKDAEQNHNNKPEIIIPLESIIIMPN